MDYSALEQAVLAVIGTNRLIQGTTTGRMSSQPHFQERLRKKPVMSNPSPIKIETRVFIDGVQASGFTVDQLHQKVREQEAVIKDLEKIENKSKKLGAENHQALRQHQRAERVHRRPAGLTMQNGDAWVLHTPRGSASFPPLRLADQTCATCVHSVSNDPKCGLCAGPTAKTCRYSPLPSKETP